jgi:hypothetical protein
MRGKICNKNNVYDDKKRIKRKKKTKRRKEKL